MSAEEQNKSKEMEQELNEVQPNNESSQTAEQVNEELSAEEKCQAELAEMKDKYLRQVAEFDNFRKRNAKERLELIQTAGKDIISDLLEIIADMDRAVEQMEKSEDLGQIKSGTTLVFNKFKRILEQKGLKPMETKNAEFDVEYHEAITEIPAPNPEMVGKVIDELQKGYFLNDKIIRHAKVVVGK
jgi:molecular chaperone GrpE